MRDEPQGADPQKPIAVPVGSYVYVAEVVKRLTENGVPLGDLFVEVSEGQLELRDETGSYGVRVFEPYEDKR